jgi:hypothetical protein
MSAYTVPYEFSQGVVEGTQLNHPVYIPLGFVIMILNHMCTIYDNDTPVVYLDFNHKSNLCLSNSKHLSTNPYEVLIPFQGSNLDFQSIIEPTTLDTEVKKEKQRAKTKETLEANINKLATTYGNIQSKLKPVDSKELPNVVKNFIG